MAARKIPPASVELQPAHRLWSEFDPGSAPRRFRAQTAREALAWQRETRAALNRLVGFQDTPLAPLQPRTLERVDKGDYTREKVVIRTSDSSIMPVYILKPKKRPKRAPVVLALHGHGYGVKDIVGLWEDGSERDTPDGVHDDFGVRLCRRGFVVAAPEISSFGERQTDFSYLKPLESEVPTTCAHTATLAFYLGKTAIGLRVWEAKRLVDYLETRRDVDASRLGAMGISGGGTHTFFSACLDTRIRACVVSGYFGTWHDSIYAMAHCVCNVVPGLHEFGEMHDVAGLIAPRPMLIENGSRDCWIPVTAARKGFRLAKKVWGVFGAQSELQADFFEGRHRISGAKAYDFLMEKLS